ncbi:MAG TPA: ATP-binding cassette domain-containing protein [Acidimicrobiales bacterium]
MTTTLRSAGAPPDLTRLTVVHRAMRSGGARLATAVARMDEGGAGRVSALARWYRGFRSEVHDHLRLEDERLFPALAEEVPSFDDHAERIEHEHRQLDRALARVGAALDELGPTGADPAARAAAVDATRELAGLLGRHVGFEDADILPLYLRHFAAGEYAAIEHRARRSPTAVAFGIPWLLEAADESERALLLAQLPPTQRLCWYAGRGRYARLARRALGQDEPGGNRAPASPPSPKQVSGGRYPRPRVPAVTSPASPTIDAPDRAHADGGVAARAIGVTKVYGRGPTAVVALDDVTVDIPAGRFTAIMGPSGSGKSTLMHTMAGLDSVTSGRVHVGDADLSTLSEKQLTRLRRDRIGFVFQSFNLVPTLTARENITLPGSLAGRRTDPAWLDTVVSITGLGDRLGHRPSELSGGQQQRVAVARALAGRPDIIFADEPTGNVDSRAGAEILEFMCTAVRDMGQTIVMVTHDPVAAAYADTALFLADGRIVDSIEGPTADRVLDRLKTLGS